MVKPTLFIATVIALASTLTAHAKDWVQDMAQCQYESELRQRLAIENGKVYGLEMKCDILKSHMQDGYTYADIACAAEGEEYQASIRFKVDGKGLHYKSNDAEEFLFPYACP